MTYKGFLSCVFTAFIGSLAAAEEGKVPEPVEVAAALQQEFSSQQEFPPMQEYPGMDEDFDDEDDMFFDDLASMEDELLDDMAFEDDEDEFEDEFDAMTSAEVYEQEQPPVPAEPPKKIS
jgi:hypothetical protein